MRNGEKVYEGSVAKVLGNSLNRSGLNIRAKLIIVFLIVIVVPLVVLASIAWNQFVLLGSTVQDIAVTDSAKVLNDSAVDNIERMTTDTANNIAKFLYGRDYDIQYAATLTPSDEVYSDYINSLKSGVANGGEWALAEDGMSWVQAGSTRETTEIAISSEIVISSNEENLDDGGWNSRPADGFTYKRIALFDEITFVDTEGMETVKIVAKDSAKKNYPMDPELKDISKRENTYVGAEDYWTELKKLRPGDIYVSGVQGVYVRSHFSGIYTPKRIVIAAIDETVTELNATEKQTNESKTLSNALTDIKDNKIAGIKAGNAGAGNKALMDSVINAVLPMIDQASFRTTDKVLLDEVTALKKKISGLTFDPENEAYAGEENPLGKRFEGIVRWATPAIGEDGNVIGYVTLALNHDNIMEFLDHQTPSGERYRDLPSAFEGNYAFFWDNSCRNIGHPRHASICGSDASTGLEQIPWLESSVYDELLRRSGGDSLDDLKAHWKELINDPQPMDANGIDLLFNDIPVFDEQSREKTLAAPLTSDGLVALDGRYLNNAPQCVGWMDLTRDGGSGSFYMQWNDLHKLTTVASVPYYTGQYAPSGSNGWSKRGFGMVTVGAGVDDFTAPIQEVKKKLSDVIDRDQQNTMMKLLWVTGILSVLVIIIAIWFAGGLTGNISRLVRGISRFRAGERQFRFNSKMTDEFGLIADSFDEMAESIVDSVKDPLTIIDMDHSIIYMNEGGLHFNGMEIEDVTGKPYRDYSVYPANTEFDPIKALEENHDTEIYYNESTRSYLKGIARWFYDRVGNKIGYTVLTTDVTDMVMRQLDLEKAVNDANIANKHKGEFLARMSHEIRTPMNAIVGITKIVLNKLDGGTVGATDLTDIEGQMQQIETSSQHLLGLLNDVLDISKIDAGKVEISMEKFDIIKIIRTVDGIIRPRCDDKHLTFNVKVGTIEPQALVGDQLRLRQVLINLLGNAVKFTPPYGSIDFIVEKLGSESGDSIIKFTVADTGIGISDDMTEKIFAPFEQADSHISDTYGGTGLGLAISRRIVDLMGGQIEVSSAVGKGSTFTFTIRMKEITDVVIGDVKYVDAIGKFKDYRALVVDDIEVNRIVVSGLLEETGIEIEEAEDGKEAVDKFMASPDGWYDIIFMDVHMPLMDGYEATETIRAAEDRDDARTVTIAALTANAFQEDMDKAKASGMDIHIAKPVDADRLVEVLFERLK